ncbi:MAG: hypothetical protein VX252_11260 [Myxococcota bacterium]|nr:hypothetical protein [Myxococcota bacterium]
MGRGRLSVHRHHRFRAFPLLISLAALLAFLAFTSSAHSDYPNWNDYVDVDVIEVITQDESGKRRESKVWFVLLGGEAYLRTSGSRWLQNLRRDPDLSLRIEGRVYQARAEEIQGEVIVEKVDIASQRKYGFADRLIGLFRSRKPDVLRIYPRDASSP